MGPVDKRPNKLGDWLWVANLAGLIRVIEDFIFTVPILFGILVLWVVKLFFKRNKWPQLPNKNGTLTRVMPVHFYNWSLMDTGANNRNLDVSSGRILATSSIMISPLFGNWKIFNAFAFSRSSYASLIVFYFYVRMLHSRLRWSTYFLIGVCFSLYSAWLNV